WSVMNAVIPASAIMMSYANWSFDGREGMTVSLLRETDSVQFATVLHRLLLRGVRPARVAVLMQRHPRRAPDRREAERRQYQHDEHDHDSEPRDHRITVNPHRVVNPGRFQSSRRDRAIDGAHAQMRIGGYLRAS